MTNGDRVWICGQFRAETEQGNVWDLQGIFLTEDEAVAACRDETYFIGPEEIGVSLPHESIDPPGFYYPHLQARPEEKP